jgi:hypothetical protein
MNFSEDDSCDSCMRAEITLRQETGGAGRTLEAGPWRGSSRRREHLQIGSTARAHRQWTSKIDQLLPWAYRVQKLKAVAWEQRLRCISVSAEDHFS